MRRTKQQLATSMDAMTATASSPRIKSPRRESQLGMTRGASESKRREPARRASGDMRRASTDRAVRKAADEKAAAAADDSSDDSWQLSGVAHSDADAQLLLSPAADSPNDEPDESESSVSDAPLIDLADAATSTATQTTLFDLGDFGDSSASAAPAASVPAAQPDSWLLELQPFRSDESKKSSPFAQCESPSSLDVSLSARFA